MEKGNSGDDPRADESTIVRHDESSSMSSQEIESMTFQISWFGLGFPGNFPTIKVKRVSMECFCEKGLNRTSNLFSQPTDILW